MQGRIVRSKAGHDKGKFYVVLRAAGKTVCLCDGNTHTINKPKCKNVKHVSITNTFMDMNLLSDLKVKNFLSEFAKQSFRR